MLMKLYWFFVLAVSLLPTWALAQDETKPILPPVLKAADDKGNKDGQIQKDELPARLARLFEQNDLDGDGVITPEEVEDAKARAFAKAPKIEDVLGNLPAEILEFRATERRAKKSVQSLGSMGGH